MKTAVEWLENELVNSNLKMPLVAGLKVFGLIKKAKEMEKQQIVDAWFGGYLNGEIKNGLASENYYNKTFKNTKQ